VIRAPRSSWLAFLLLAVHGLGLALPGLALFVVSLLGGGVGLGDDPESFSSPLGLLFGLVLTALGGGLGWLGLAVRRGRVVASAVAMFLAGTLATLGAVGLALDRATVNAADVLGRLAMPLVLLGALLSPGHRRYVTARRLARHPAAAAGPSPAAPTDGGAQEPRRR
jgi:hypothetical protein